MIALIATRKKEKETETDIRIYHCTEEDEIPTGGIVKYSDHVDIFLSSKEVVEFLSGPAIPLG
jgi:hypothetical protein